MKKQLIIHPFLFAVFPLLYLWMHNIDEVGIKDVALPLLSSVFVALVLWAVLRLLLREAKEAGIITSLVVFLFFSYGHLYYIIKDFNILGIRIGSHAHLLAVWSIVLFGVSYWVVKTNRSLRTATTLLNFVSVVLVVFPLVNVAIHRGGLITVDEYALKEPQEIHTPSTGKAQVLPDVYYIILNGYANSNILKDMYGYDNSGFLDYLRNKGFYVAEKSRSNYSSSDKSLKSSLNMRYLRNPRGSRLSVKNNVVMRHFKRKGYIIVNFPSGYHVSTPVRNADVNIDCGGHTEFAVTLIETTLLSSLTSLSSFSDYISAHIQRVLCTLNKISWVHNKYKEPVFVFAHIICPYPPYVFGENGVLANRERFEHFETKDNFIGTNDNWSPKLKEYYLDQIGFLNKKLEYIIDEILSYSEVPPIIILQSDHGSAFNMWDDKKKTCTLGLPDSDYEKRKAMIAERLGNFNAYYLPEKGKSLLYDSITPINTFRIILNILFGINYGLASDRIYWDDLTEVTNATKDYFEISR